MLSILCSGIEFTDRAISFWGFEIYYYAIIITSVCACNSHNEPMLKRKGFRPIRFGHAIIVFCLRQSSLRIYFLLFLTAGVSYEQFEANWTWASFWTFATGGWGHLRRRNTGSSEHISLAELKNKNGRKL